MTIYGWDMSHYDAPGIGDAISEGIRFITHKAGGDATDAEMDDWWNNVKNKRDQILVGSYWVLYPGNPSGRADQFISRLDDTCPGWRDAPFILQVDCEMWGGDAATVPSKNEIEAFCDRLVQRMPKLRPIVYGPKWVYGNSLSGLNYPLWASNYVSGSGGFKSLYPGDGSSRWSAYSGQVPAILQYTSSATIGGQTTCDANAFRGTLAELTQLTAPGWSEDEMTPEEFTAMLSSALTDSTVAARLGAAAAKYDPGYRTPGDPTSGVWPGVSDATFHDPDGNGTVAVGTALGALLSRQEDQTEKIDTLLARPAADVDEASLAAALAPLLNGVSASEIETALRTVLREGVGE